MKRLSRLAPAVLTAVGVLGLGVAGLVATRAETKTATSLHGEDRQRLETTLAGLGNQYELFTLLDVAKAAKAGPWALTPDSASDRAGLEDYVAHSILVTYGAVITDDKGAVLTSTLGLGNLPAGGFATLASTVKSGKAGVSDVEHAGNVPVVAYAVPINGRTLLVGLTRIDTSPLQQYVSALHYGKTGYSELVDSKGTVVASAHPALVGRNLGAPAPLAALARGRTALVTYRDAHGVSQVAAVAPLAVAGWGGLTVQTTAELYGPITHRALLVEIALVVLLAFCALIVVLVNRSRIVALRRELKSVTSLWEARERFRHAFEETPIGMALIGVDEESWGRFLQVNKSLAALVGRTEAELLELRVSDIVLAEDQPPNKNAAHRMIAGEYDSFTIEVRLQHADGRHIWIAVHASLVRDPHGRPLYSVAQIQDLTARKQAEDHLAHLASHDPLSGLANRSLFMDRLRRALDESGTDQVAVLYLDLDRFKDINDELGHEVGDELIQEVAARLNRAIRPTDVAARLGGDEFAVLCEEITGPDHALSIAERIERSIAEPVAVSGGTVQVTASVGIAVGGSSDAYVETLLRDADTAMYGAKQRGKARCQLA